MSLLSKPTTANDWAAKLLLLSGILHLAVFAISGFAATIAAVFGVIYLLCGFGLLRDWRKLAYLAFVVALVSVVSSYGVLGTGHGSDWVMGLFIILDLGILVALFMSIWKR
jgi:hypothetical protein